MKNSKKYFKNYDCEFYPCHSIDLNLKEIEEGTFDFNCLFCYCPQYHYDNCLGNPLFLDNGKKDCSVCIFPHRPENYDKIIDFIIKNNIKLRKKN